MNALVTMNYSVLIVHTSPRKKRKINLNDPAIGDSWFTCEKHRLHICSL